MNKGDIDTIVWMGSVVILAIGCTFQWGWPAALITIGGIFSIWPLVKQFAR